MRGGFTVASSRRAVANLLVVDVSTAQHLFDQPGRLSRIDLIAPSDESDRTAYLDRVRRLLPEGAHLRRSDTRTETVAQMTEAFDLNLTALSLLALIVGAFLIYNTMTFSIVQRRGLLGRLRALGVTRGQVFRLVLGEAAAPRGGPASGGSSPVGEAFFCSPSRASGRDTARSSPCWWERR